MKQRRPPGGPAFNLVWTSGLFRLAALQRAETLYQKTRYRLKKNKKDTRRCLFPLGLIKR